MSKSQYWNYQLPDKAADLPYAQAVDIIKEVADNIDWALDPKHLQIDEAALDYDYNGHQDESAHFATDWISEFDYFIAMPANNAQFLLFQYENCYYSMIHEFGYNQVSDWAGGFTYLTRDGEKASITRIIEAVTNIWQRIDNDSDGEITGVVPSNSGSEISAFWCFYIADKLAKIIVQMLRGRYPQLNIELDENLSSLELLVNVSKVTNNNN